MTGKAEIILTGALAAMVRLGLDKKPAFSLSCPSQTDAVPDLFARSVKVVAGARNQLDLLLSG
jgi:hypothetical protein